MKVLHPSQIPTRLPFISTWLAYMTMDLYDAPGWMWGMGWTLITLIWIIAVVAIWKQDHTKILELTDPRESSDGR